jgi:hypothetical protein
MKIENPISSIVGVKHRDVRGFSKRKDYEKELCLAVAFCLKLNENN